MFENLLKQLGKAANAVDYFDRMEAITERIVTVSLIRTYF